MLSVGAAVIAVTAGLIAVLGLVGLAGGRGATALQRAVREAGTPAQRRAARAVVARRGPVGPAQVDLVAAVAAGMLARRRDLSSHVSMVLLCLAQVLVASSWILVAVVTAGVANAGIAVVMAHRWWCARRFLDDHPDLRAGIMRKVEVWP